MFKFSKRSRERLETCHPDLIFLAYDVIKVLDITVLQGHRTAEQHAQYVKEGRTRVSYNNTMHRFEPSRAFDIAPYPIPRGWGEESPKDLARFYYMGGIVKGVAASRNIPLRWGGDWNSNGIFSDQTFDDLVHFELVG